MKRVVVAVAAVASLATPVVAAGEEPPANTAPVAVADTATVAAGASVVVPVLANDTDDGLGRPVGTPPALEVVSTTGDSRVTFTPQQVSFRSLITDSGPYTFSYVVSDGELTSTASVTISITPARRTLSLTAPATVVALHRLTLSGQVKPPVSATVTIQKRLGTKPWRSVARRKASANGRFTYSLTPKRPGRLRFRAVTSWGTSPVVDRRVVLRPDVVVSGPLARSDVPWSYRAGCPVGPSNLRRITVTHLRYDGLARRGSVVVAASTVPAVTRMFTNALRGRFRFKQLVPADKFYAGGRRTPTGSDLAAMAADNTSAFNCRSVTGNPYRLSQHSYGNAIDINTVRNPYVTASRVYPPFAGTYLNRSNRRPGMLFSDGIVNKTFRAYGWRWGARWTHPDYQHFSSNGG
jgi:hypothetical protein